VKNGCSLFCVCCCCCCCANGLKLFCGAAPVFCAASLPYSDWPNLRATIVSIDNTKPLRRGVLRTGGYRHSQTYRHHHHRALQIGSLSARDPDRCASGCAWRLTAAMAQAQVVMVSHSHGVEAAHENHMSRGERSWREKAALAVEAMAPVTQMAL